MRKALKDSTIMALATSVENLPNVRVVNYVWDENLLNTTYFTSDRKNNKVAIFTIPTNLEDGISLRSNNGVVSKINRTIKDIQKLFLEKSPSYAEALLSIGESLDLFQIILRKTESTLDFENMVVIDF